MEQIISQIKPFLPVIGAVLIGLVLIVAMAVILVAVLLIKRKKKKAPKAIDSGEVPPPQNAAHTLMTDDTLELVPHGKPALEVEYEITFVHSDEVI